MGKQGLNIALHVHVRVEISFVCQTPHKNLCTY